MNKKLLAVAVAGVFGAPAVALAQSSVVISGQIKGGYENLKIGNYGNPGLSATGAPSRTLSGSSQHGVVDDSSALVFSVTEDLGGGMQAVVRLDMRIKPDDGGGVNSSAGLLGGAYNTGNIVSGNSHFGLRSNQWGRIIFGRQDLHYFNTESNITDKGSLRASPVSLLSYAGGGGTSITTASRTTNVVHYLSPNWSGFTFILAYSSNPAATESDISSGLRKGGAWNFNPNFAGANWQVGYSYWDAKPDGPAALINGFATGACGSTPGVPLTAAACNAATTGATTGTSIPAVANQRGDRLYGSYVFPFGLKIGAAWDKSSLKDVVTGVKTSKRDAWSIPVSYAWGNHTIHVNYTQANRDSGNCINPVAGCFTTTAAGVGIDTKANMWAVAYSYDLSKRTSLALTYASINNHSGATYNLFTSTSLGLGQSAGALKIGEDPKTFGLTMRHAF